MTHKLKDGINRECSFNHGERASNAKINEWQKDVAEAFRNIETALGSNDNNVPISRELGKVSDLPAIKEMLPTLSNAPGAYTRESILDSFIPVEAGCIYDSIIGRTPGIAEACEQGYYTTGYYKGITTAARGLCTNHACPGYSGKKVVIGSHTCLSGDIDHSEVVNDYYQYRLVQYPDSSIVTRADTVKSYFAFSPAKNTGMTQGYYDMNYYDEKEMRYVFHPTYVAYEFPNLSSNRKYVVVISNYYDNISTSSNETGVILSPDVSTTPSFNITVEDSTDSTISISSDTIYYDRNYPTNNWLKLDRCIYDIDGCTKSVTAQEVDDEDDIWPIEYWQVGGCSNSSCPWRTRVFDNGSITVKIVRVEGSTARCCAVHLIEEFNTTNYNVGKNHVLSTAFTSEAGDTIEDGYQVPKNVIGFYDTSQESLNVGGQYTVRTGSPLSDYIAQGSLPRIGNEYRRDGNKGCIDSNGVPQVVIYNQDSDTFLGATFVEQSNWSTNPITTQDAHTWEHYSFIDWGARADGVEEILWADDRHSLPSAQASATLYAVQPDGTGYRRIIDGPETGADYFDISPLADPNGLELIFGTTRNVPTHPSEQAMDIVAVPWTATQLPDPDDDDSYIIEVVKIRDGGTGRLCVPMAWSPDALRMLFVTTVGGARDLYEVVFGTAVLPVTSISDVGVNKIEYDPGTGNVITNVTYASYNYDGSKILISIDEDPLPFPNEDPNIWSYDVSSGIATKLTDGAAQDFNMNPDGNNDGTKIAFYSNRDGIEQIYTMDSDGTNQAKLIDDEDHSYVFPKYSPDGTKICFLAQRIGTQWDTFVVGVDGSNLTCLTADESQHIGYTIVPTETDIELFTVSSGDLVTVQHYSGHILESEWTANGSITGLGLPLSYNVRSIDAAYAGGKLYFLISYDDNVGTATTKLYTLSSGTWSETEMHSAPIINMEGYTSSVRALVNKSILVTISVPHVGIYMKYYNRYTGTFTTSTIEQSALYDYSLCDTMTYLGVVPYVLYFKENVCYLAKYAFYNQTWTKLAIPFTKTNTSVSLLQDKSLNIYAAAIDGSDLAYYKFAAGDISSLPLQSTASIDLDGDTVSESSPVVNIVTSGNHVMQNGFTFFVQSASVPPRIYCTRSSAFAWNTDDIIIDWKITDHDIGVVKRHYISVNNSSIAQALKSGLNGINSHFTDKPHTTNEELCDIIGDSSICGQTIDFTISGPLELIDETSIGITVTSGSNCIYGERYVVTVTWNDGNTSTSTLTAPFAGTFTYTGTTGVNDISVSVKHIGGIIETAKPYVVTVRE